MCVYFSKSEDEGFEAMKDVRKQLKKILMFFKK